VLASASQDKTLKLWDVATGACTATLSGHGLWVTSCAWSPDGRVLASASKDKTLKLWDTSTHTAPAAVLHPPPPPPPAPPSPPLYADVAELLTRLSLSQYGPALVAELGARDTV